MSYNLYEIEEPDTILRMLTSIPDVKEGKIYPKPPVKKLFSPQRCESISKSVFDKVWNDIQDIDGAQGQD